MDRRACRLIFLSMFTLCALLTKTHVLGWNDGSRVALVDAITADHRISIDGSPFAVGLGDKIRYHGRYYSDKPPLLSMSAAVVVTAVAPLGITLRRTPRTAVYLLTLFTVGLAFAIGCCYAFAFQRLLGFERHVAVAVAVLTGVGTLALPYATVFANHVPCGVAFLAGCYHLVRARSGDTRHLVLGGFFFALAYAFDATAILFTLAAAVLLWGTPARTWLLCLLGALPIVVFQFGYNLAITGTIAPPALNPDVWRDPTLPFHDAASDIYKLYSPAQYATFAYDIVFGRKGLIPYTPLMLVVGYGLRVMLRATALFRRIACAAVLTLVVLFIMIVVLQNDATARNFGERRYVDLFFVLCIALGPALTSLRGTVAVLMARVAIVLSVAIAGLGTVAAFGGGPGESGFAFATADFVALAQRSPLIGVVDIVSLLALIAIVVRLTPFPRNGTLAASIAR